MIVFSTLEASEGAVSLCCLLGVAVDDGLTMCLERSTIPTMKQSGVASIHGIVMRDNMSVIALSVGAKAAFGSSYIILNACDMMIVNIPNENAGSVTSRRIGMR